MRAHLYSAHTVNFAGGRGGRGKGKRRFAPQGVWRSQSYTGGTDAEPLVWLPRPSQEVPLPLPRASPQVPAHRRRTRNEYYLAEVSGCHHVYVACVAMVPSPLPPPLLQLAQEFWGASLSQEQRSLNPDLIEGVYRTLKDAK